jgi:hypothetical protein
MIAIGMLVVLTAGIAFALHMMIRRYLLAVLATGVIMDGVLFLLQTPGRWRLRDTIIFAVAALVAMGVSAIVGAWPAVLRKRRRDAVRGFDVINR